ncbi:hypothetical protein [Pseudonocardia sp. ICBG601]|uniref:hypothetical protein n=1 Tax=Pseudonocardia sp. ICBG601 TaxID=2846759 RepID=UPI001CF69CAD|nr:hypothetical protein [Pseudonocardia sp. ICBG601]
MLGAAELGYELGRFGQVESITARVSGMPLRTRERSRLTWLRGAFHDGSTSEPAEILHLVALARRATADDDGDSRCSCWSARPAGCGGATPGRRSATRSSGPRGRCPWRRATRGSWPSSPCRSR